MSLPSDEKQPLRLTDRVALRPREVAAALGVSDRVLRQWMRDEGLPYVRLGGAVMIRVSSLERWLADREVVDADRVEEIARDILSSLD